jgi:hypothetical protein
MAQEQKYGTANDTSAKVDRTDAHKIKPHTAGSPMPYGETYPGEHKVKQQPQDAAIPPQMKQRPQKRCQDKAKKVRGNIHTRQIPLFTESFTN